MHPGSSLSNFVLFLFALSAAHVLPDDLGRVEGTVGGSVAKLDLAVSLSADDVSPVRRQPFVLTLTLANESGASATGVVVSMPLPSGFTYSGHVTGIGKYDPVTGRWTVGTVQAGESRTLVLTTSADAGTSGQTLDVVATVAADQPDGNAANDSHAVSISVQTEAIEILRDLFGVAHVFAHSDQGACFGAGYATAQDRLSQLLWNRLVATGRIAAYFGRGAKSEFIESDRRVRLYGHVRHAVEAADRLDPELRSLLESYADGVNAFMASRNTLLQPPFAQAGVPLEPWTPADSIAVWNQFGRHFGSSELSEGKLLHEFEDLVAELGGDTSQAIAKLLVPAILDDSAAVMQQSDVPANVQEAMQEYAGAVGMGTVPLTVGAVAPKFSQVFAVTPDKSADGRARLVADPRIPIRRPNLLYEVHLSGATFDVRGAGPVGAFGLLVGSTDDVAWGATALGLDQEDLFRIHTDPIGHPGEYRLDGAFRPFEVDEMELIAVQGGAPETVRYRETVFGPLVTQLVQDVRQGEEYAARTTLFYETDRIAAEGYLAMFRAQNVDEFSSALAGLRFPSMNVVFADSSGRIGYRANGAVPARSVASPVSAFSGRAALEGDVSANDWLEIVPHELMPWVLDPADGILFSANHMAVGSWYPLRIGLTQTGTGDTSRSRRLRELLVGVPPLNNSDVQRIRNDAVAPGPRDVARLMIFARDALGVRLSGVADFGLRELEPWLAKGAELRAVVRGVLIAALLSDTFRPDNAAALMQIYGTGAGGAQNLFKTRIAELEATGTASLTSTEIAYLDQTLAEATTKALLLSGPPAKWLATFAADVLTMDVPAWTDLNGFEALDPTDVLEVGPLTAVDERILGSQGNQSYAQHVSVGHSDVTRSLMPFGAGEPGSVHATDQVELLEAQRLRPSPTSRPAIEALGGTSLEVVAF